MGTRDEEWRALNQRMQALSAAPQAEREAFIVEELVALAREMAADGIPPAVFLEGFTRFAPPAGRVQAHRLVQQAQQRLNSSSSSSQGSSQGSSSSTQP